MYFVLKNILINDCVTKKLLIYLYEFLVTQINNGYAKRY